MLQNSEQFNLEDEGCARGDSVTGSAVAVGEVGGDKEFVFAAWGHELYSFGPAGDDLIEGEVDRFSALDGAVEDGTVGEFSGIVSRGGISFDCRWREGKITYLAAKAKEDVEVELCFDAPFGQYSDACMSLKLKAGEYKIIYKADET